MCGLIAGFAIAGTIPGLGPVGCLFELSACAAVSAAESQEAASDVGTYRITPVSDKYDRSAIAATGADIIEVGTDYVIVMALPGEVEAMRAMGFGVEGVELPLDFPDEDSDYHNFDEMVAEIEAVASAHSDIVKLFSIGQSYKGRELWTMKISDNPEVDESAEAAAYIMGGHHAREHLTVEMTLAAMNYLVDNYGTLQRVTDIVNNREVYITFNVNPDGSERDIEDDYYHYKRKNMQGVNGTDLNRNYSYNWGCCGGSSSWVYSETYRGASAFDAPETAAVRDFVEAHSNIKTSLSFHSYAELVMWPYGYTYTAIPSDMDPSDHARFVEMGEYMANSNGYTAGQSSDLYITDGHSDLCLSAPRGILPFPCALGGTVSIPGTRLSRLRRRRI